MAILFMLLLDIFGATLKGYSVVGPAEATQLINREDAVVIDVRETKEYAAGHIVNSIHIPLQSLQNKVSELEKHKSKKLIVGCQFGNRSASACAMLKKQGFENIYNLKGGMAAWTNASLPLTKA
ncbi:MAG: rhodanese-like domain-containing protein [Gammaproteobacteria bacterium]|nr:rhodanese-like domain-containing protein [Gammaproteobacteria bacterium]MDH5653522.1 rhodanese-like domain-containing protein [Gammaproteobacteria bacterium]